MSRLVVFQAHIAYAMNGDVESAALQHTIHSDILSCFSFTSLCMPYVELAYGEPKARRMSQSNKDSIRLYGTHNQYGDTQIITIFVEYFVLLIVMCTPAVLYTSNQSIGVCE